MICPKCNHETYDNDRNKCESAWVRVLKHFGINRHLFTIEKRMIDAKVREHGSEAVFMCIVGSKYEKGSDEFNPSEFLTLARIFKDNNFIRLSNLGAQAIESKRRRKKAMEELQKMINDGQSNGVVERYTKEQIEDFKKKFNVSGMFLKCEETPHP